MPRHQHAIGRKLVSTAILGGLHLHQTRRFLFPFGRAVRSARRRKRSAALLLPPPRCMYCFSWSALNLFVFHSQSAPIHATHSIPFGTIQCSLGRLRHALTALISEPLISPFKSDIILPRDKSETPSSIGIHFCLKSAQIREAGKSVETWLFKFRCHAELAALNPAFSWYKRYNG